MTNKVYNVCVGPIAVPGGEAGYQVLTQPQVLVVKGASIKIRMGDISFYEILDKHGNVVFSTPTHLVIWCIVDEGETVMELLHLVPPSDDAEPPKVRKRRKKVVEGDG